jgi:hypothetical protein
MYKTEVLLVGLSDALVLPHGGIGTFVHKRVIMFQYSYRSICSFVVTFCTKAMQSLVFCIVCASLNEYLLLHKLHCSMSSFL